MRLLTIDIETYKKEENGKMTPILDTNELVLVGIREAKTNTYFTTAKETREYLRKQFSQKEQIIIYSHNANYDFYGIWKEELKEDITKGYIKIIRPNPLLAIINNKHYWTDTMSFWQMSAKDYGEQRGLPKLEMPEEITSTEEIKDYLARDLELEQDMITYAKELYKKMGYNPRKLLTGPSTAIRCYIAHVNREEKSGWILNKGGFHKNNDTIPFIRQASKGGIIRAFKQGITENTTYIDINSSYWDVMRKMPYPDTLRERTLTKKVLELLPKERVLEKEGVVKATVHIPETDLGILAIRYKARGEDTHKLRYPNKGIITGYWTTYELREAIKRGYKVQELHKAIIYEKILPIHPLKNYIEKLWEQRKAHDNEPLAKKFYKNMGNSLYGKFIQKTEEKDYKWIKRYELETYIENGWKLEYATDDYCISKNKGEYIPPHHSTVLGVMISAYARIKLIEYLEQIDKEKRIYCDTDGIILQGNIPKSIPMGENLGEFKIEHVGTANIIGPKVYTIGEEIKASGIPKKYRTKENIHIGKEITFPTMINLGEAIQKNKFEELGRFTETTKTIQSKTEPEIPYIYEEAEI